MNRDEQPMMAKVELIQHASGRWRVRLAYSDGDVYLSRPTFETEEEARSFAQRWTLENMDDRKGPRQ
jgi:hypothetical protein